MLNQLYVPVINPTCTCYVIFLTFFYCFSSTAVSIFLPPLPPNIATLTSHPWSYPALVLSMCPSYMFLKTLPPFPCIIPSHLPSGYCQFVLNFNVSGYILLACLFCWLGSTYRWDLVFYLPPSSCLFVF